MNKAERVDVSQLIADCRAGRVDSPVADRLERLIQAAERGTSSTKTPVERRQRPRKPPELIAGEAAATQRSGGRCEHPSGCTDTATVHHHRAGRTRHGAEFLMHLCHHHRHVHANPEESYANGAMLHRHGIIHDPLGWAS